MSYEQIQQEYRENDHKEITLSNSKLLAMFLGAAVVCGICFGFGYSLGKHSAAAKTAIAAAPPPAATQAPPPVSVTIANAAKPSPTQQVDANDAASAPTAAAKPSAPQSIKSAPVIVNTAVPVSAAAAADERTYIVQVAAVTRKSDADILQMALQRKGYQVSENTTGGDNYIRVQIGPFASQKDAAAMRDRLSSDGYNSIVK